MEKRSEIRKLLIRAGYSEKTIEKIRELYRLSEKKIAGYEETLRQPTTMRAGNSVEEKRKA